MRSRRKGVEDLCKNTMLCVLMESERMVLRLAKFGNGKLMQFFARDPFGADIILPWSQLCARCHRRKECFRFCAIISKKTIIG